MAFKTSEAERQRKAESNARIKARDPQGWQDRQREYQRTYKQRNPDVYKETERKQALRKFGMSIEDYETKLAEQDGRCAICLNTCPTGKRLAVDHNHATGTIRSLLCGPCNMALGQFEQDNRLERAADYLARHTT